jgi:hypothetical protein
MGRVARRVMEMDQGQLEGQIRVARGRFIKIFLLWAGYMVLFAVQMALVGRVVETVRLLAARPAKTVIDLPVLALVLFGAAVVSVVAGMGLCMRGGFDRRFRERVRINPDDRAKVEQRVDDLVSAALPGLDGAPYQNVPGAGRRSNRLAWAGRLLIMAALETGGVIYIFIAY